MTSAGRPPRIVLYTDAAGRGGAEISLGHLVAGLSGAIAPTVVGVAPDVVHWIADRRPGTPRLILPARAGVGRHLRAFLRLQPDLIHVNRCTPWACVPATVAALLVPRCRVVTVDQLPLRTTSLHTLSRTRALARRTDAVVTVGTASARRLEDWYALGRGSVLAISNGVPDVAITAPADSRGRDAARVIALGRLDRMKGFDVLLHALARLESLHLTICGEGAERPALVALARQLGIGTRVEMRGWVEEPAHALREHDVFALPSRSEGCPLALIEAMMTALACVVTPVGSVPEVIRHGECGLVVPVDDVDALAGALRQLCGDAAVRRHLGSRARSRALEHFTASRMAARYEALWLELVGRLRTRRLRPARPLP